MSFNVQPTKYTSQHTDNFEHDEEAKAKRVIGSVTITEQPPTAGNNGQTTLGYTGVNLTTITKTINGVQYQKTLAYTGSVLDSISSWTQL